MRTPTPIVLLIAAILFAGGCGTSGGDNASDTSTSSSTSTSTSTTTTTVATIEVEEWAATFCGNFGTWLDGIQAASTAVGSQVTAGDFASAQTAISGLFGTASEVTGVLITEIEAGGAPDIDDGEGLVDDLVDRFGQFVSAADQAKADTDALEVDPATFEADAKELTDRFSAEVESVGESFDQIDADYASADLNAALTKECAF